MKDVIAIAEPSEDGSEADPPTAAQAQDALASAIDAGATPPQAIEDGVIPAYDLSEYHNPLVILVPYATPAPAIVG